MTSRFQGSGRLREGGFAATHRQDFRAHTEGGDWRHTADQTDMNPAITTDNNIFNASTVQATLEKFATFLNTTGQGFISIGDGYDTQHADFIVGSGGDIASAFNDAFLHPRLANGGVILVKAGTYRAKTTVTVPPGFVIMGELGGTIIQGEVIEQPMFIIKAAADRPIISANGITTNDPIDKNQFFNITLADNLDGYVNSGAPCMTTVPMIRCETGAYLTCTQATFVGKMGVLGGGPGFGRPKTLYAVGFTNVATNESTVIFEDCTFDGLRSIIKYDPASTNDKLLIRGCKARVFGTELFADRFDASKNCFILVSGTMNVLVSDSYFRGDSGNSYVSSLVTFTAGNPAFSFSNNAGILTLNSTYVLKSLVNTHGTGNSFKITVVGNDFNGFRDHTTNPRSISAYEFPIDTFIDGFGGSPRSLLISTLGAAGKSKIRLYVNDLGEIAITVNASWTGSGAGVFGWTQDDATRASTKWIMNNENGFIGYFMREAGSGAWIDLTGPTGWHPLLITEMYVPVTDVTKFANFMAMNNGILWLNSPSAGANNADSNPTVGKAPFPNTIYAKNVPKAWGYITTDGSGGYTVNEGFGIDTTIVFGATWIEVTLKNAMTNTRYAIMGSTSDAGVFINTEPLTTTTFALFNVVSTTGSAQDPATNALTYVFTIFGEQA